MPNPAEFDALVIGGGPAGCAFALRCAAAGMRVALLEAQRFPRVLPGETLHPGVEPIFAQLGVLERVLAAGFHRHRGVWVEWDGPRAFQAYGADERGPWRGFQAERARLDALLLAAAREAGIEIFQPCRAVAVLRHDDGEIIGLATSRGPLRAPWIADASGRRSWLARQLGLPVEQHSPPLHVRFGWSATPDDEGDGEPTLRADPGGWDWSAPLGDGRCAWAKLRLSKKSDATPLARARSSAGLDLRWRCIPACAGPGYFLLGDAAATLDPSSSHGVLRALMSGLFASHQLAAIRARSLAAAAATAAYRDWLRGQFTHDTAALRALWSRHPEHAFEEK